VPWTLGQLPPPPPLKPASRRQLGLIVLTTCEVWQASKRGAAAQRRTRARRRSHTPVSPMQKIKP
jgi:hypothetical protein